eukprot:TRINITY_DN7130_c0_g1_i5.p1 TRINITY_DN7130_c0_g1~~TRINITY_DN7130_c0_g1_i5.p1  ORF type:complete len:865 (+),score=132.53 TRINITY_DN7130_c0_g1_i5:515-3109(+)
MQARENTCHDRTDLELRRALWRGTGYVFESGGLMADIRALTNATIKNFHKEFYRPDNLCVIITGVVSPEALMAAMVPVERKILAQAPFSPGTRPWTKEVPLLRESEQHVVLFPDKDEDGGAMVNIGWQGPSWSEQSLRVELYVLLEYLTDSAISPVRKAMVDCPDPLASDVSYSIAIQQRIGLEVAFEGVKTANIDRVPGKFREVLSEVVSSPIDMKRLGNVLNRIRVKRLASFESSGADLYATAAIADFLFSKDDEDTTGFEREIDRNAMFLEAAAQPESRWREILAKYLVDAPSVCILAKPSAAESDRLAEEEKARVGKLREELGTEKLQEISQRVEEAISFNERECPMNFEELFPIPSAASVRLIHVDTWQSGGPAHQEPGALADAVAKDTPKLWVQFDSVRSAFVGFRAMLSTEGLSDTLRKYIPLFLDIMFECPIIRDGVEKAHEEVVAQLTADSVSYSNDIGFGSAGNFSAGSFSNYLTINLKFEQSKYAAGAQWVADLLWFSVFTEERVRIGISRLLDDAPSVKRSASGVCGAVMQHINFNERHNGNACNVIRQSAFLTSVRESLDKGDTSPLTHLEELRQYVSHPSRLRFHVFGPLLAIENFPTLLKSVVPANFACEDFSSQSPIKRAGELVTSPENTVSNQQATALVVGVPSTESSYLIQTAPGLPRVDHADWAASLVLMEYLDALEGPFWKQLRGQGLTYGYGIRANAEEGLFYFRLTRSTNVAKAYGEAKTIVDAFCSGNKPFDASELAAARSGVIYAIVEREGTPSGAAYAALSNYLNNVSPKFTAQLLQAVNSVTAADLQRVSSLIAKLFQEGGETRTAVTANPAKADELVSEFATLGKTASVAALESILA